MQCEGKLKNIFKNINPDIKFIKTHDTAESAKKLQNSKNDNTAVIPSSLAAIAYNSSILITDIQDVENLPSLLWCMTIDQILKQRKTKSILHQFL